MNFHEPDADRYLAEGEEDEAARCRRCGDWFPEEELHPEERVCPQCDANSPEPGGKPQHIDLLYATMAAGEWMTPTEISERLYSRHDGPTRQKDVADWCSLAARDGWLRVRIPEDDGPAIYALP